MRIETVLQLSRIAMRNISKVNSGLTLIRFGNIVIFLCFFFHISTRAEHRISIDRISTHTRTTILVFTIKTHVHY